MQIDVIDAIEIATKKIKKWVLEQLENYSGGTSGGTSSNDYTSVEKEKLATIQEGAEKNVNADWKAESGDAQILNKPTLGALAVKSTVEKSDLSSEIQDALDGALSQYQETDPSVPSWAKHPTKPKYTASEVGALPADTVLFSGNYEDLTNRPKIPSKVSDLENDKNYITGYTETDPTVPAWAKEEMKPKYTADEVGAATKEYVDEKVAGLVDSAPDALNTLNELAMALGKNENFATTVTNQISNKVDKVEGKVLSSNDLTDELQSHYDAAYTHSQSEHAPADAEKNVQSNWNENDTNSDSYIQNKPTAMKNPSSITFTGAATGTYDGSSAVTINIPKAQEHVNSDWNETNVSSDAYISNKPTSMKNPYGIEFTGAVEETYDGSAKVVINIPKGQDNVQSDWAESDSAKDSYIKNKPGIASTDNLGLIKVGTGLHINPDSGVLSATGEGITITAVDWSGITNTPTTLDGYKITDAQRKIDTENKISVDFVDGAFSGKYSDLTDKPSLSSVATSGDYNDLSNKPKLFSGSYDDLSNKPELFSKDYNDLSNKPTLFSGSYNDLLDRPTLPSAHVTDDGVLYFG